MFQSSYFSLRLNYLFSLCFGCHVIKGLKETEIKFEPSVSDQCNSNWTNIIVYLFSGFFCLDSAIHQIQQIAIQLISIRDTIALSTG